MAIPLPSKVVASYFTLWNGSPRITAVPLDYNQIYLFHATPVNSTTGAFSFTYGASVNAADIKAVQARGQRVVLTVGGANAGFNFQTRAQSDAFLKSFQAMNTQLGGTLDGCDFNNFEAFVGSSPTEMAYMGKQLKALYGANFSITCPPHPGASYAPNDHLICKAMSDAGALDYAGPQYYDSPDLITQTAIVNLTREWVSYLGDASKVAVGLSANYAGGPTLATCQAAWNQLVKEFPTLRGVFAWSAQDDQNGSWNWGKTMGPLVKTTQAPAPGPSPAPSPSPTPVPWVAGVLYKPVGTLVTKNSKTYELYQVGTNGTSDGTDPEISTWYWRVYTAPVPALKVGDHVTNQKGQVGTIKTIVGTTATVVLDTQYVADTSTLTKV